MQRGRIELAADKMSDLKAMAETVYSSDESSSDSDSDDSQSFSGSSSDEPKKKKQKKSKNEPKAKKQKKSKKESSDSEPESTDDEKMSESSDDEPKVRTRTARVSLAAQRRTCPPRARRMWLMSACAFVAQEVKPPPAEVKVEPSEPATVHAPRTRVRRELKKLSSK